MLMGIREYARHRRLSAAAVRKAIRSNRITCLPNGKIDSVRADEEWRQNTRSSVAPENGGASPARALLECYRALLVKHEYEQRRARLVRSDEVKAAADETYGSFRRLMLRLPDTLAPVLARETDADRVHEILAAEIRTALNDFADSCVRFE